MIEILIFGPLLGSLIAGFMYRSIGENVATILATSIVILTTPSFKIVEFNAALIPVSYTHLTLPTKRIV